MTKTEEIDHLTQQNEALRKELLTPQVFVRLVDWLGEKNPKPASAAFTASIERQIAYALEIDVLPVVKSLQLQLANALAEVERYKRGEVICGSCGLRQPSEDPVQPNF